jgi:hypothetical protein
METIVSTDRQQTPHIITKCLWSYINITQPVSLEVENRHHHQLIKNNLFSHL